MVILIHDNLKVSDLQERFSKCFQSLKIEFYGKSHNSQEKSAEKYIITPAKRIGEIRRNHEEGDLEIESWNTADQVEKDFKEKFGLNVQVLRRNNGQWVQTSKTDKYTLFQKAEIVDHGDNSVFPRFNDQWSGYDYL